ncbi:MAG: heavy metal translocating P-type ATPase [Candidatus Yanofskybacteria bacterium]|nr:heavy metal translocating P-type ATPase [Candidatus Yanofskybacteria bacterium]
MHPNIIRDKPGLCPGCGMTLLPQKSEARSTKPKTHAEYDKHAGHDVNIFALKFWVSLALTFPILLYSELPERFFGWKAWEFSIFNFQFSVIVPLVLGSVIFFYGGLIFIQGAYRELRVRLPGMMTLIALAITVAYVYSVVVTFLPGYHTLFGELATLITIMLLGHWMEMRAVQGAQGALQELSKLLPDKAEVVRDGRTESISLSELKMGDIVLIRPGSKIPADGIVVEGAAAVSESMITGESAPVEKQLDSKVIAGTVSGGDGALKIKITEIGEQTFLAGVMRLVAEAQASKSRLQLLSDRAAYYLTLIAITGGAVTFGTWTYAGSDVAFSIARVVAVLVIACPHALGLAIPLVASISTSLAAKQGFLVRQRSALELAKDIDIVVFDKTGTLTKGEYGVTEIIQNSEIDKNKILRLAASVDRHSEHFVSKAIVKEAGKRSVDLSDAKDFKRLAGKGAFATVNGIDVSVGGESLIADKNLSFKAEFKNRVEDAANKGQTVVFVVEGQELLGAIALSDIIREESRETVNNLKKLGIKVAMLTGDSEKVAGWVAKEMGIDEYFAKVLPRGKVEIIKRLQGGEAIPTLRLFGWRSRSRPLRVGMVGDGINDAPALTQADLGIAIGAGTNVAIESAGIILVRNDPRDIVKIISLSKAAYSKMIQNLFWATGYNVVAIPLAAGVLAPQGILLQPAVGAIFMSLSTVIVAANALLLKGKKL